MLQEKEGSGSSRCLGTLVHRRGGDLREPYVRLQTSSGRPWCGAVLGGARDTRRRWQQSNDRVSCWRLAAGGAQGPLPFCSPLFRSPAATTAQQLPLAMVAIKVSRLLSASARPAKLQGHQPPIGRRRRSPAGPPRTLELRTQGPVPHHASELLRPQCSSEANFTQTAQVTGLNTVAVLPSSNDAAQRQTCSSVQQPSGCIANHHARRCRLFSSIGMRGPLQCPRPGPSPVFHRGCVV